MAQSPDRLYEQMLVLRAQAGDAAAFEEIVGRYGPRLHYFLRKLLAPGAGGAEDLLQDVWLDVFRRMPRLKDAGAFTAWAYRIARDRAWLHLRHERRHAAAIEESARNGAANNAGGADAIVEGDNDDDDCAFSEQDVALVHACLDDLGAEHREVLVLRFLESMSYQDIATVTACNLGTVRSRLHYAKRALRHAIQQRRRPS